MEMENAVRAMAAYTPETAETAARVLKRRFGYWEELETAQSQALFFPTSNQPHKQDPEGDPQKEKAPAV